MGGILLMGLCAQSTIAEVSISPRTVEHSKPYDGSSADASFTVGNNGSLTTFSGAVGSDTIAGEWLTISSSGAGSAYEVRFSNAGGIDATGPAYNTWHSLATSRTLAVTQLLAGTKYANVLVEIRPTSGAVLDSANIELTAFVEV
jgi:hypothetical protein